MGMDLISRRNRRKISGLHYNWTGWRTLWGYLNLWGVNTDEFSQWNEGAVISGQTCRVVAEKIREHQAELLHHGSEWIEGHEEGWRAFGDSGGCEQW